MPSSLVGGGAKNRKNAFIKGVEKKMLGAGHKGPSGRTTKYFSLFQADMFFISIQRVAKGSKEANFLPTLIRLRIEHMLHSIIIVLYNIILGIKRPRNNNISHIHI